MKSIKLVYVIFILLLGVFISFLIIRESGDYESFKRSIRVVNTIKLLNNQLNEDILKSRASLLLNFDPISNKIKTLKENELFLVEKSSIQQLADSTICQSFTQYQAESKKKINDIEKYKIEYSVLYNSLKSLPLLTEEFTSKSSSNIPIRQTLNVLIKEILIFNDQPELVDVNHIQFLIEEVSKKKAGLSIKQGTSLDLIIGHAQIILAKKKILDEITFHILNAKLEDYLNNIEIRFDELTSQKIARGNQLSLYLYAVIFLLMSTIGYAMYSIIKHRKEVDDLNFNLEKKVIQRTQEIQDKNEELEQQAEQLEAAYNDVYVVSKIGKEITANLSVDTLVESMYENINQLMDAYVFAIGIYDKYSQVINFSAVIEEQKRTIRGYDIVEGGNSLSVWCFKNQKEILIKDYEQEKDLYLSNNSSTSDYDGIQQSAIFLPLISKGISIGAITVQSNKKAAYEQRHLMLLQSLASYVSNTLDNTQAYQIIKNKNTQITDSIRYALTIQAASLPSEAKINQALYEYFVLYQPKDIVSGDFYWFNHIEDKIFIAVVDCTGHGVPGAFMSLFGSSFLNEIVNIEKEYEPNKILEQLHIHIRSALKQDEGQNQDGMDVSLCLLEPLENAKMKVTFSGAKRPLHVIHEGELLELKGDKKSIGGLQKEEKRIFSNKEIVLNMGDCIYLSTDGIIDQNNPTRRRFGTPRFKEILQQHYKLPMSEQKVLLTKALQKYQQDAEQRDDITVLGLRV